ncbi:hypothetical protein BsIDN1_63240 [Bacillus safensis]|uniref:Uncharacterized protein n=1 Tax=Bacillus safensis TaxID=561879 RepID=A0A5S9MM35_BACIA|nr:hypothetical protein BsIDN1_63240 [Bacillus safensis]
MNDLDLKVNQDFGYTATPGTEGSFMVITDTFGLPKGVKQPEKNVKKFLSVLGSVEGQDAFNPLKGSIPARVDADVSKYDEYGKSAMKAFKESKLAPSLAHGSAAEEGFVTKSESSRQYLRDTKRQQSVCFIIKRCNEIKTKEAAARHRLFFLKRSVASCA